MTLVHMATMAITKFSLLGERLLIKLLSNNSLQESNAAILNGASCFVAALLKSISNMYNTNYRETIEKTVTRRYHHTNFVYRVTKL